MPAPSAFRDILQQVGEAIVQEILRLLSERGRYPLRRNSALAQQLLSPEAVQVAQQRGKDGRFGSYGLTIVALDYLQWLDTGRAPGTKKVPISALLQFIKNRGLGQVRAKNGRFGNRTISANSLAFAIQTAIYKNGIKGRHVLAQAWATGELLAEKLLDAQALDAMTADLERQFSYLATA